jgi:hypothetical protein
LNDCHSGACGGHLSGLETSKKNCVGYFCPTIFKDCVEVFKKCHPCQISLRKCVHIPTMFPVITIGPFTKWGVDFMTCHPASARGHHYIIVVIDYFTKWVEAMPTFSSDGETSTLFIFNQVIARFRFRERLSLTMAVTLRTT